MQVNNVMTVVFVIATVVVIVVCSSTLVVRSTVETALFREARAKSVISVLREMEYLVPAVVQIATSFKSLPRIRCAVTVSSNVGNNVMQAVL
jgi:hypothetical protein